MKNKCLILFSGGTDSMCAAALSCEKFSEVHLVTFFEESTKKSIIPIDNMNKLKAAFPNVNIKHTVISNDLILKKLSYENYFKCLGRFKFLNLSTPGLSSLSWHLLSIVYCKKNNIKNVVDGMTKELLHLPGHMPEVRQLFTQLYSNFDIDFSSPVIDWDIPEDQRFIDKLIIDRHGFSLLSKKKLNTTGEWLYKKSILPHPNVKGTEFDRLMQHDCYPFVVYNMLVFWFYEPLFGYADFKNKLVGFFKYKIEVSSRWVIDFLNQKAYYNFLDLNRLTNEKN